MQSGVDYNLTISNDLVNITSANVTIIYGQNATVNVTLNSTRATGIVTVVINGKEFNATLVNGTVLVNITCDNWAVGEYVFNITYPGDGNFTGNVSANYTLNITKSAVNVTGANVTIIYGDNATINVTLNNTRATGNITIMINGTPFNATISANGTINVTVDVDDWASGNYTFNITYYGDGNFTGNVSANYTLNITKAAVNVYHQLY